MLTALRILLGVAVYRLRRLEMANLGGAVAVMLALRLGPSEIAVRTGFAFLLNLLAYLTNDYCDIRHDLASGRADEKTRYLASNRGAALGAQIGLGAVLAAIALAYDPGLLVPLVVGEGLCWLYSARLKYVAFADVAVMAVCGGAMALVAVPLDRPLGWLLVGQLGLFSGCFELIQVLRDRAEDELRSVRTTAVVLGERGTLLLLRAFMLGAAAFGALLLSRWFAPLIALAVLVPYGAEGPRTYWNRVRVVFGVAWLCIVGHVLWTGTAQGSVKVSPAAGGTTAR